MSSTLTRVLHLATILHIVSAIPLPHHHLSAKRSTTSQNVGSGFAIAICVVLLAVIFYYLGMHHERTKLWLNKRKAPSAPISIPEDKTTKKETKHTRQISCPLAVSSSAPIKAYDDPVEAPTPSLRYYELPIKEVHEMGLPSPKKPPRQMSWLSLDRKPWWLKYPENEEQRQSVSTNRSKSVRSWFRSEKNLGNVQEEIPRPPPPTVVEPVHLEAQNVNKNEKERTSDGSTLIDWSGLDYVRKIYAGRKSRVGL